jgi:hypothetical protein
MFSDSGEDKLHSRDDLCVFDEFFSKSEIRCGEQKCGDLPLVRFRAGNEETKKETTCME